MAEKNSRREFLGKFFKFGVATAVEAAFGPARRALEGLGVTETIDRYSTVNKFLKTERIMQEALWGGEQEKELFYTWLKFNGAAFFAKSKGWELTDLVINHFLYGDGDTLDISDQFSKALRQFTNQNEDYQAVEQIINGLSMAQNREQVLERRSNSVFISQPTAEDDIEKATTFSSRFILTTPHFTDIYYSMNTFSVTIQSEDTTFHHDEANNTYLATILNPTTVFYDRYDWEFEESKWDSPTMQEGLTFYAIILEMLQKLGFENPEHIVTTALTEEMARQLRTDGIFLTDNHAYLLVSNRLAKEFDMYAQLKLKKLQLTMYPEDISSS